MQVRSKNSPAPTAKLYTFASITTILGPMQDRIPINTYDSPTAILELIFQVKVKDVMTSNVVTAPPDESIRGIQSLLKQRSITGVPITEAGKIIGILSMEDVLQAVMDGAVDSKAEERMSRKVIALEECMPVFFAISYFGRYSYRRFPVVNRQNRIVGVVTSRDITNTLLREVNQQIQRLEDESRNGAVPLTGHIERWFDVKRYDFENAGFASTEIKKHLKSRQIDPKTARRIAVAAYELEMNIVLHSSGGSIHFLMDNERAVIHAEDKGPGIPDTSLAMTEGYTTATEWIQSLGFGAGLGLPNVQRVSDEFQISSEPTRGTHIKSIITL